MEAGLKVLVDTNILIKAYRGDQVKINNLKAIKENYCISIVTAAELLAGAKTIKQLSSMEKLLKVYRIVHLNEVTSKEVLLLYRKYIVRQNIHLPDCFIAATAIQHHLQLYTDNAKDYSFIKGLNFYQER